ncbi:hypothetical protein KAFR_0I02610 [Kazachstania africana CBS 2517]|uniref:Glycoside hydrolase family 17 protein n=1 Tax=Kazachstania africana (strain ATCC 22294 / BCRC 22015 / CBS 2517 / CECT 1963 / NBRC 1671 / NRRL Y-8276) TaxID=1071382 RepID=H2B090_KAZAF|nr:hypothetical protein KAFR_0I02610 [Kazachstania africana CBS 2517]CCF60040.1 hypothetical protein KAFR_0I02610 [Kazachstania africana CBS 2517]
MRFANLVSLALLSSCINAAPAPQHHEHREKRDAAVVTTTVETNVNVVVGTSGAAEEAVNDAASVAASSATTTATTSTSSTSTSTSTDSSSTSSGSAKGLSYSPYNSDGSCKALSDVKTDLANLTDYSIIRLYGVDCQQVENVLQAKQSSQKLFLGIYYMDAIESGVSTIQSAIESYGSWDDVYTVSIGNELVNSGSATASQIEGYVNSGKTALTAAGYTGPVVSVDTFTAVIDNTELCNYSDYIAVNAHAYFDYYTAAADAGTWLKTQISRVSDACGGNKTVLITESGWPSQGETYGSAVPSKANQEAAISSIKSNCGDSTILFTAYNDLWKADGSYGVEKWWGVYSRD